MVGQYTPSNTESAKNDCEFTLTIESDDVEKMINSDPTHSARISGTVTCPALSETTLTISQGG